MYPESISKLSAVTSFVGFNLTFMPQFIHGYLGMPRRYHGYAEPSQNELRSIFGSHYMMNRGFVLCCRLRGLA